MRATVAAEVVIQSIRPSSGRRSRPGCSTGTPASSAATFTGLAWMCPPRPAGRSGCVTTATTRAGRPATSRKDSSVRSEGTAKAGVPMKTRRSSRAESCGDMKLYPLDVVVLAADDAEPRRLVQRHRAPVPVRGVDDRVRGPAGLEPPQAFGDHG